MTVTKVLKQGSVLLFSLWIVSCAKYKEIPYFQDVPAEDSQVYTKGVLRPRADFKSLKIQSGDILQISIQSLISSNAEMVGLTSNSGFSASDWQSGGSVVEGSSGGGSIPGYLVDNNGEIELPLVGKVQVAGLTLSEIKEKVRVRAEVYYKSPVVNVRLANFKVTVLGEVSSPGTYIMDQDKATLLDALGMAGDLTIYGKRTNVLLAREVDGKEKLVRLNLNSTDILNSPYFYLQQGDVVYVQPSRGKATANDALAFRLYTILTSTVSLIIVIATRFK